MKKKFLAAVMALVMIGTTPVGVFADTMVKSYLQDWMFPNRKAGSAR